MKDPEAGGAAARGSRRPPALRPRPQPRAGDPAAVATANHREADMSGEDWSATRWIDDVDDDLDGGDPRRRRSGLLLVASALPWIVVVALLLLPGRLGSGDRAGAPERDDGNATSTPGGEASELADSLDRSEGSDAGLPGTDVLPSPLAPADPTPPDELELFELRGAWRLEPGDEAAAALAIVVARAWLTGMDPRLDVAGLAPDSAHRYAEHLLVEAVERISDDSATVTIVAVVLEGEDALDAGVRRLAVPILWGDDGPQAGGEPWPLRAPTLRVEAPGDLQAILDADEQLAAVVALESAGFAEVELLGLDTTAAGPVVARIRGLGPDDAPIDGAVWLRRHLGGFAVSGATLTEHTDPEPTPGDTTAVDPSDAAVPLPGDLAPSSGRAEDRP